MSHSTGAKLRSSDSRDIELLTAIRQDLQSDGDDGFLGGNAFVGLVGVEHILSEVLGLPYNLGPDGGIGSASLSDQASLSDSDDETWVEEWEPKDLYKWILDELRGLNPQDLSVRCLHIRRRLEDRLVSIEDVQPSGDSPDAGNSSKDSNTNQIKPVQPDVAIGCPISFLPVELLLHVFHLARACRREIRIPLTLSHVSSHFRSVALGDPSLWSSIDNLLPIPIVELYLTRSEAEPLCCRMWADHLADLPSQPRNQWWNIIFKGSERIKVMEVYGCNSRAFSQWTDLLNHHQADWSSLAKLELLLSESGQMGMEGPQCPKWKWFLGLQDLSIQGYPSNGWLGKWDPFPPGLRRLKVSKGGKIPISTLLKALGGLPNLHVLNLDHCSLEQPPVLQQTDGITMTNIEELEVTRMLTDDIRALISQVHTPNLTSLSITYPVDRGLNIAKILIPFTKAHPELRSLQIRECTIAKNEWSSILQNVASLNHLAIRASDLRDEDLRGLALGFLPIVPNMTHLTLENELRLTTSLVEQVVRTHPQVVSVILRGWNASNVSQANVSAISRLVSHVEIQTFGNPEDEDCVGSERGDEGWNDSYWEGSDFSEDDGWLSGDEAVVAKGRL